MSSDLDSTFGATYIGVVVSTLYVSMPPSYRGTHCLAAFMAFLPSKPTRTGPDTCTTLRLTGRLQVLPFTVRFGSMLTTIVSLLGYSTMVSNDLLHNHANSFLIEICRVLDTFQLACICHMQYHYVINNYANPTALLYNNW
jgi:hypothetical protein